MKRLSALMAVWLCLLCFTLPARAEWPARPVKLLVPLPPGGTADSLARILAEKLALIWNKPVVVENRPGGNGIIGSEALARAAPDGYVIGMGNTTAQVSNAFVYSRLPYDPERDFTPLAWLTSNPMFLIVHPSVPARNLQEFIAYAKSHPGKLSYASNGVGSSMHLAAALLMQETGIDMLHVPYKGMGAAVQDLVAGMVSATVDISSMNWVKQGKLRALGVISESRYPGAPDVPSFGEQGLHGLEIISWLSLHAPAGLPADLQQRINADVNKVLAMPDVRSRLKAMDMDAAGGPPERLTELLHTERQRYGAVIKAAGIHAE
ncbi:MAG: hypothetical protein ABS43_12175 [Bordetella sp. SCN 67-23]|nr:tripartite tricarboxylate transporter substrate binding protein [Burkholderiales bacterium]ODS73789.1 MAG: hypothetical protein ABS43_12175 [Bordetella sp. SCN 67-23]OJW92757.1 MAG: hypothetical protein BGO71_23635 [Burkholderiales bacterium 67-32]